MPPPPSAGTAVYRSDFLLNLTTKPAGQRSGPEVACLVHFLGCLPSFKEAPLALRLQLSSALEPARYAAGSQMMAAGRPVDAMHIIVEGSVGMFKARSSSKGVSRAVSRAVSASNLDQMVKPAPGVVGIDAFQVRRFCCTPNLIFTPIVSGQPTVIIEGSVLVGLQGKAAHIRSKHQQHGGAAEPAMERQQTLPTDKPRASGGGAEGEEGTLAAGTDAGDNGDEALVKLITSAHVRSAMMMANLIEGRDLLDDDEQARGGTTVVRTLLPSTGTPALALL